MPYPKTIILFVALSSLCMKTAKCMEAEQLDHPKRSASSAKLAEKREFRRLRIEMETGEKNAEKYGSLIKGPIRRSARIANPVVKPVPVLKPVAKKFVVKKKARKTIPTASYVAKRIDPEDLFKKKCREENPKFHCGNCKKNQYGFPNPTFEKYAIGKELYDEICEIHAGRQGFSVPYADPGLSDESFICLGHRIFEWEFGVDEFGRSYHEQPSAPVFALPKIIPSASNYSQSPNKKRYAPSRRRLSQ